MILLPEQRKAASLAAAHAAERAALDLPASVVPEFTLWQAYRAACADAETADGPAPTRTDNRPRVETFRGRRLRTERGREWGTIVQKVNGEPVGVSSSGWDAAALDRAAAQLRRDVIGADQRYITDPAADQPYWHKGAPEPHPAVVAWVRHFAEREAADRAALAAPDDQAPAQPFVSDWALPDR